jgi:hypothetical protein
MALIKPVKLIKGEKSRIRRFMEGRVKGRLEQIKARVSHRYRVMDHGATTRRQELKESPYKQTLAEIHTRGEYLLSDGWFRKSFDSPSDAEEFYDNPPAHITDVKSPEYNYDTGKYIVKYRKASANLGIDIKKRGRVTVDDIRAALDTLRVSNNINDAMEVETRIEGIAEITDADTMDQLRTLAAALIDATMNSDTEQLNAVADDLGNLIRLASESPDIYEWEIFDPQTGVVIIAGYGRESGRETLASYRYSYGSHLEIREKADYRKRLDASKHRPAIRGVPDPGQVPSFDNWVRAEAECTGATEEQIRGSRSAYEYARAMGWSKQ